MPCSLFICHSWGFFPTVNFVSLAFQAFLELPGKFSSIFSVHAPRVANQLLYVMEFTGSRTCLPLFPGPLGTKRLYHIWHDRMASICLSHDLWLQGPHIFRPACTSLVIKRDDSHLYVLNFKQQRCYGCRHPTVHTNKWARLCVFLAVEQDKGLMDFHMTAKDWWKITPQTWNFSL